MEHLFEGGTGNTHNENPASAATEASRSELTLDDPITMQLTEAEVEQAHLIKALVESDDSLDNLTDFEYVQYALTHSATTSNPPMPLSTLLGHVAQMQAFREEYKIQDTVEEGTACTMAMAQQHPGLFLSVFYLPTQGNCISINDWASFYPTQQIQTPQHHAIFMKGLYYRFQAMNPTFYAIRQGLSCLFECEGATSDNFSPNFWEQLLAELYLSYPKRSKEMYLVNSPSIVNVAYNLWKKYMTNNMKDTFHLGFQIPGWEGKRIDGLFKLPTPEAGQLHMVLQTQKLLMVRYHHHQTTYELPALPPSESLSPSLLLLEEESHMEDGDD